MRIVFLLVFAINCFSAVPQLINYSGKLTDNNGNPITGTKNVIFAIYDTETGGVPRWSGTYSVSVSKGVFNILLGSGSYPFLNLDFSIDYWLEMKVEGETLTPRQKMTSVAYAMRSEYSNRSEVVNTPMIYTGRGDIDIGVSERCYIHLEKIPKTVKMYLWGEKFSTQFYTELASHNHNPIVNVSGASSYLHSHSFSTSGQSDANNVARTYYSNPFDKTVDNGGVDHVHTVTVNIENKGVNGGAISTVQKTYLNNMRVYINNNDMTASILSKLLSTGWTSLGSGNSYDNINNGTGEIDITTGVISWTVGQHYFEFRHPSAGGGRVRYNIYIYY